MGMSSAKLLPLDARGLRSLRTLTHILILPKCYLTDGQLSGLLRPRGRELQAPHRAHVGGGRSALAVALRPLDGPSAA
eukprot:gene4944-biopygen1051